MDISVVIPCHNEESNLERLVNGLRPVLRDLGPVESTEVVLVDDGSTDSTWQGLTQLAEKGQLGCAVRLERHQWNRGLGAALRTGFAASRGRIIITTDSDGTYRFSEIPGLMSRLTSDVGIVTASPYHPQGGVENVPSYRLILSRGSSLIYRALVDRRIHTYTALFRAYRGDVVRTVEFTSDGFLAVAELLVNARLAGYRVVEYPAVLHSRIAGTSKARLARTIVAHIRFQLSVLMRRIGLVRRRRSSTDVTLELAQRR
jgi:dolichol-phosphate mannosyltransferase